MTIDLAATPTCSRDMNTPTFSLNIGPAKTGPAGPLAPALQRESPSVTSTTSSEGSPEKTADTPPEHSAFGNTHKHNKPCADNVCMYCGKVYSHKSSLSHHMVTVHSHHHIQKGSVGCDLCSERYMKHISYYCLSTINLVHTHST